jgi:predicted O-methyltransferase YrrM
VVVDGRARADCLRRAVEALTPGGLIVFDNSDRKRYQPALAGLAVTRYRGRAPALPIRSETALIRV